MAFGPALFLRGIRGPAALAAWIARSRCASMRCLSLTYSSSSFSSFSSPSGCDRSPARSDRYRISRSASRASNTFRMSAITFFCSSVRAVGAVSPRSRSRRFSFSRAIS
ncbi:MAG: hypothetical protein AUI52_06980 [Acidobacteria bacterium 13_1_40CM_2_68_10]|nr:MAG: hypothetical protein AUI52_06980 [Acidobacteria bacterium 13_1_40CM_2_68_10]